MWWQQIRKDVPLRRRTRGWEQQHLAAAAGIALNTVQRIERGEWVAAHNRFQVCSALDLQVAQTVDLDDPAQDAGRRGDRSMPSTVATSIATPRVTDGSPFSTARIGQPVLRGGWSAPSDGM